MKYISKDLNSYKLHLINTDKFKTVTVKVLFRSPIVKDKITIRNVLCDILLQSTLNYNSRRKISIKTEDLYSAHINNNVTRNGNYITSSFTLSILNDKYTEKDNMVESIKFLSEILFNPDVVDKKFNEKHYEGIVLYDKLRDENYEKFCRYPNLSSYFFL